MTNHNTDDLVQIKDLSKVFPGSRDSLFGKKIYVHAVSNVSLSIHKGETLGIVGESGCGKSTLGRCILRLMEPSGGEVSFDGKNLLKLSKKEMRDMRKRMQIIFQDPYASLNPRMTVLEAVIAPLDAFEIGSKKERLIKAEQILHIVGIDDQQMNRYPHEFSGGQRQRIDIARALVLDPDFVVCDEPVSALDASVRASVLNLMKKLQGQFGLTYLFISHDLSVVKHISDRVAVMYLGSIVEIADTKDLYNNPAHPYTKALLAAIPLPDPTKKRKAIPIIGEMPSPYDVSDGCPFHNRCPYYKERCKKERPQLQAIGHNHWAACHEIHSWWN